MLYFNEQNYNNYFFALNLLLFIYLLKNKISLAKKIKHGNVKSKRDNLTGFGNELSLFEDLQNEDSATLCVVNICNFREINNIFSFEAGNYILQELSILLNKINNNCYRLDNDTFAVHRSGILSDDEIMKLSNNMFARILNHNFKYNGDDIAVTVNMGFSKGEVFKEPSFTSCIQLLHDAKDSLKEARARQFVYYIYSKPNLEAGEVKDGYYWKQKIISSLNEKRIIPYFQPIYENRTGEVSKYEALIRIKDSDDMILTPGSFMQYSKKYHLSNLLTKEMLNHIMHRIMKHDCEISINLEISDILDSSMRDYIYEKLKVFPKADKVVFEILESEGIDNYNEIERFINQFKKIGCKMALDDFGCGYSNFSHLLNLQIDYLKIDASIIKNIANDMKAQKITKLIVELSRTIGAKTVAEFVDSKHVFSKVKELEVDYSQGYYLGKPQENLV